MKKFYSILSAALLSLMPMAANAISIHVNVDDPARVSVQLSYSEQTVVAGDNVYEASEYASLNISAKSGCFITSVKKGDSDQYVSNYSSYYGTVYSTDEGAVWTVVSCLADDARDAQCTIKVDDPSKVRVQRSGTYSTVELVAGDNTVKFISTTENYLNISQATSSPIYKVTLNGTEQNYNYGYYVPIANGDVVEITTAFPDVDVPVHFNFADATTCLTSVTVNGEAVTNYADADFAVKAGSTLAVNGNTSEYKFNSFKVNGVTQYYYGSYSCTVTSELTFDIDAHKYSTVKATLNVDNADNITIYRGYDMTSGKIDIVNGENQVEFSETDCTIRFKANSGCYITSILDANGTEHKNDYSITLTDGMYLTFVTGAIQRDSTLIVYVDDKSKAATYFNFMRGDHSSVDIETGYNTVMFYDGDVPFGFSCYGPDYCYVYQNDELMTPMYEGSKSYSFNTVKDFDVIKIYLAGEPAAYSLTCKDVNGVSTYTVDEVHCFVGAPEAMTVLDGTSLQIENVYGEPIYVNDVLCTPEEGKDYVKVYVHEDTNVVVGDATTSISSVNASQNDNVIYNFRGQRVNNAGHGLYIINGQKIIR